MTSTRPTLLIVPALAVALIVGFVAGRSGAPGARADAGGGAAVASFAGGSVSEDLARAALAAEPIALRAGGVEAARRVVEELARTRLLALRAVEKGYDRDPEFARRHAEQLAALYLEKEAGAVPPPTDEEVRQHFDAHRAEVGQPERVRVALVSFAAASPSERTAKRARAAAALQGALARRDEHYAFGDLARARSEDARTAARGGELGELTREELAAAAGPEIAAAAFAMPAPGVHEALVESASGYHVLKLLGREAAHEPPFEDLRHDLRERLARERRAGRRKAAADEAFTRAEVRIDDGALRRLVAELGSASR